MSDARRRLEYEVARRFTRGDSIRGIARALRIDRKTVRRILGDNERRRAGASDAAIKKPRAPRTSKLDDHVDFVRGLLVTYPNIHATRVLEELQSRSFDGGYTIVRELVNKLRPKAAADPHQLVETEPGKQAQVDWAHHLLGDGTPIYALLLTLCFSRHQYIELCADMRQPTLFRALCRAFEYQGGVAEEYVFDSMPGIVDRCEDDKPVLNLHALDLAAHYRFSYDIAPRYTPTYKAKVERNVRGLRSGYFNGRTLLNLDDANVGLLWWLEHTRNPAKHPKRSESRAALLAAEGLNPLPAAPYDTREVCWRLVDGYGYVRFELNFYRAPAAWIGRWVCVRAGAHEVELYDPMARPLGQHRRAPRGAGRYVPPPEAKSGRRRIGELIGRFDAWGGASAAWARELRHRKRYAGVELERTLALQETYRVEDVLAAIAHAARYGAYEAKAIGRILEAHATPRTYADRLSERTRTEIRSAMAGALVRQRDLAAYGRLLAGPQRHPQAPEENARDESEAERPGGAGEDP